MHSKSTAQHAPSSPTHDATAPGVSTAVPPITSICHTRSLALPTYTQQLHLPTSTFPCLHEAQVLVILVQQVPVGEPAPLGHPPTPVPTPPLTTLPNLLSPNPCYLLSYLTETHFTSFCPAVTIKPILSLMLCMNTWWRF